MSWVVVDQPGSSSSTSRPPVLAELGKSVLPHGLGEQGGGAGRSR
jgi:hypothetical protein